MSYVLGLPNINSSFLPDGESTDCRHPRLPVVSELAALPQSITKKNTGQRKESAEQVLRPHEQRARAEVLLRSIPVMKVDDRVKTMTGIEQEAT